MNILIVKLSAIGDVIHTLPALAALRRLYPDADITWVVEEAAADLLTDHPHLDRVLISRRKSWLRDLRRGRIAEPVTEIRTFLRELRSRPYDLVIDFHGLFKSAAIVLLSGGKRKLGYDSMQEASGLFYNEKIPEAMGKHAVDRYLDFARYLEGDGDKTACSAETPEFAIALEDVKGLRPKPASRCEPSEVIEAGEHPRDGKESGGEGDAERRFVAVSPVAFWETKLWEEGKFAELGDRIRRELGVGVILTGGESEPLERIRTRMKTAAVNLGGQTTLRELASLYRDAALVITTDSGPMHLAAAVGTPVVALFGPTDPARTGPYGSGHRIVRRGLSCSPCFRKQCDEPRCMTEITVENVFAAVREILGKQPSIKE